MEYTKEEIKKFLEDSIEWLKDQDQGCSTLKLDDRLAICVGWLDGYDENDEDVIHSTEDPDWAINAGIKVYTSDDMLTDYEFINSPYYDNGDVVQTDVSVQPNANLEELAEYFIEQYESMKDLNMEEDGRIIEDNFDDSYEDSEEDEEHIIDDREEVLTDKVKPNYVESCDLKEESNKVAKVKEAIEIIKKIDNEAFYPALLIYDILGDVEVTEDLVRKVESIESDFDSVYDDYMRDEIRSAYGEDEEDYEEDDFDYEETDESCKKVKENYLYHDDNANLESESGFRIEYVNKNGDTYPDGDNFETYEEAKNFFDKLVKSYETDGVQNAYALNLYNDDTEDVIDSWEYESKKEITESGKDDFDDEEEHYIKFFYKDGKVKTKYYDDWEDAEGWFEEFSSDEEKLKKKGVYRISRYCGNTCEETHEWDDEENESLKESLSNDIKNRLQSIANKFKDYYNLSFDNNTVIFETPTGGKEYYTFNDDGSINAVWEDGSHTYKNLDELKADVVWFKQLD